MDQKKKYSNKKGKNKSNNKSNKKTVLFTVIGLAVVLAVAGAFVFSGPKGGAQPAAGTSPSKSGSGIVIQKGDITETATFIPYKSGGTSMEVVAVKAPDGTIRTAFNTCQVCFDSGRGYYVQEGDQLVCQNCGNRFKISQVEKQKNGCNPVPILSGDKTEDDSTITIPDSTFSANAALFADWKR
jgi:uncharacterized membrane protein